MSSEERIRLVVVAIAAGLLAGLSTVRWLSIDLFAPLDTERLLVVAFVIPHLVGCAIVGSVLRSWLRWPRLAAIALMWVALAVPLLCLAQPWDCTWEQRHFIVYDRGRAEIFVRDEIALAFDAGLWGLLGVLGSRRWRSQRVYSLPFEVLPCLAGVFLYAWIAGLEAPWSAHDPRVIPRVSCTG